MTEENCIRNIALEMESAEEARKGALALLETGLAKSSISRTYYFAFHTVKALLYSRGLEARSHEGAGQFFSIHFIRSGELPAHFGKFFYRMQKYRQLADYEPSTVFTLVDAEEELAMGESFHSCAVQWLKEKGHMRT